MDDVIGGRYAVQPGRAPTSRPCPSSIDDGADTRSGPVAEDLVSTDVEGLHAVRDEDDPEASADPDVAAAGCPPVTVLPVKLMSYPKRQKAKPRPAPR